MGDVLNSFIALTEQFAKDMDAIYQDFEADKQEIGEDIKEESLRHALEQLKATRSEHFDQMLALAKEYLNNIRELPQGEHPDQ